MRLAASSPKAKSVFEPPDLLPPGLCALGSDTGAERGRQHVLCRASGTATVGAGRAIPQGRHWGYSTETDVNILTSPTLQMRRLRHRALSNFPGTKQLAAEAGCEPRARVLTSTLLLPPIMLVSDVSDTWLLGHCLKATSGQRPGPPALCSTPRCPPRSAAIPSRGRRSSVERRGEGAHSPLRVAKLVSNFCEMINQPSSRLMELSLGVLGFSRTWMSQLAWLLTSGGTTELLA